MINEKLENLVWEYIDGDISQENLETLERARKNDPDVNELISRVMSFDSDIKKLPLEYLDSSFQVKLQDNLINQIKKKELTWYKLVPILIVSVLTLFFGLWQLTKNLNEITPKATEFAFSEILTLFGGQKLLDTQIEVSNVWLYVTFILVIPLAFLMDQIIQKRIYSPTMLA